MDVNVDVSQGDLSWETLSEQIPKFSQEQISEYLELLKRMVTSSEEMRKRAIYVNLKGREVETPLEIKKEEPKSIFIGAEIFLKTVQYLVEELPEPKRMRLKQFFSELV